MAGKEWVKVQESTLVSVVPTRAWVWMPVSSYSDQKVGVVTEQDAPLAQFRSYGTSGQLAAVEEDRPEVAQPPAEVEQRPLTVKVTWPAGEVEYTVPARCPYMILLR